jgi:hypothetical protein
MGSLGTEQAPALQVESQNLDGSHAHVTVLGENPAGQDWEHIVVDYLRK